MPQALLFINILESKDAEVKDLWEILISRGMTEVKIRDIKKKCLALSGKCNYYRHNYVEATEQLNAALLLIPEDERKENKEGTEEIVRWLGIVAKDEAHAKKKEKAVWSKAFKRDSKSSSGGEDSTSPSALKDNSNANKKKKKSVSFRKNDSALSTTVFGVNTPFLLAGMAVLGVIGGISFYFLRNRTSWR